MTDAGSAMSLELVVGLEVHVQLKTATKIFCACRTEFGAAPNANCCPVCLGLPGALPVLNERAVALAVRAGVALGGAVQERSVFARKNYFYPDLPKGYQITQFDRPIVIGGGIDLPVAARRVRLTRIHMEEDAGKSIHDRFAGFTAVDLNRAGTPLIEIVTEPDIRSAGEAREFLNLLKEVLQYTGVSDANMEEGSLRVDANVSVRPRGEATLGAKTEIKNMNSFSSVERAIEVEFARQCARVTAGERVVQETLLWDAARAEVRSARSKEDSHDYRYFPEPDLRPLMVSTASIDKERERLPELPAARRSRYVRDYNVPEADAAVLTQSREVSDYYDRVVAVHGDARTAAHWIVGDVLAFLNDQQTSIRSFAISPADLSALIDLVRDGRVSRSAAKRIFQLMAHGDARGAAAIASAVGLVQVDDVDALEAWVDEVCREMPREMARLAQGETKVLGAIVGAVMKRSAGRADPRRVNELVQRRATDLK